VRSLLAQGGGIEIVVVDDGSEDATARIVRGIASGAPAVTLVTAPPLIEGWLGKNHALDAGARKSPGEWLLFTDADTRHAPGKLREVVQRAEREGLDLVSFSPRQEVRTGWERAVIPQVYRMLARLYPYGRVNDPLDSTAAANGQYILIRRDVYFALGGHQAIRDCVLEDVELARRAKQAGYRIWFGPGDGIVSTRMYRRFGEMWEGWTKNLFLLYHRDRSLIRRAATELVFRYLLPAPAGLALLFGSGVAPTVGGFLLAYAAWEHVRYWRELPEGKKLATTLYLLPGASVLLLLLLNSERRYGGGKGIEWKGRRYEVLPQRGSGAAQPAEGRAVPRLRRNR
jgi:glycosyltransferase involved in cell wall biosynthesis